VRSDPESSRDRAAGPARGIAGRSHRLAVLTGGLLDDDNAKTAHGILRYADREVVAVVDERFAGRVACDVVPYARRATPVVATVAEAAAHGATTLVIGVAPLGGRLAPEWRAAVLEALARGMDVEAGLHAVLADDPELARAAREAGRVLRDLRAAPADLDVPAGPDRRPAVRVVHAVGSDCAIGKMSVTLELDAAARRRGLASVFVPTGQTGVAIAGWGIAVDHVISDFVAGAAARLVEQGAQRGDLLFVEGQGALTHPAYSGVTLGLLHGTLPDVLVLCHRAGATHNGDYGGLPIPPLADLVAAYESAAGWVRPATVAAVALNTRGLDDAAARAAVEEAAELTGRPADDPVRFGADALLGAVLDALVAGSPTA
jgi:uncharacterized NAD-dependent epimerase/dehydratase family protein